MLDLGSAVGGGESPRSSRIWLEEVQAQEGSGRGGCEQLRSWPVSTVNRDPKTPWWRSHYPHDYVSTHGYNSLLVIIVVVPLDIAIAIQIPTMRHGQQKGCLARAASTVEEQHVRASDLDRGQIRLFGITGF